MNGLYSFLLVAAKKVNNAPDNASGINTTWIIIAVSAIILGVVGYFVFLRLSKIQANSHFALFQGLCRLHNLDATSRKILRNIAQHYQLEKPVQLFIEPAWLEKARSGNVFSQDSKSIDNLRGKLFG
jgi:hypothetical protein